MYHSNPCDRQRNQGSEKLSNLSKIMLLTLTDTQLCLMLKSEHTAPDGSQAARQNQTERDEGDWPEDSQTSW